MDENQHQTILLEDCKDLKDGTVVVAQIKKFPTKKHPAF